MKSRIRARKKSPREQTPDFSTAPAQPMFQSRPFVVQSKEGEKSIQQKTDLKTQLSRATRFGHNVSQMKHPGSYGGEKVVQCAERRVTTYDKPKGEKNWKASMELIDSDDKNHYVHISRSTDKGDEGIPEGKAKEKGLRPVEGKNAKSQKMETQQEGQSGFDRKKYTKGNNVHITLEGRYRGVLSKVAETGGGRKAVKGGPPVAEGSDNLNYGDKQAIDTTTIEQRIEATANEAQEKAKQRMTENFQTHSKGLDKTSKQELLKEMRDDHDLRKNKINEIKTGSLQKTNDLIESVPALAAMKKEGRLVQYHGQWN